MRTAVSILFAGALACANGAPVSSSSAGRGACASDLDCAPAEVCADGLCVRSMTPLAFEQDGGGAPDAGAHPDGGPAPDGGGVPDAGAGPDGGTAADAGSIADGGPVLDGGGALPCTPCTRTADCGALGCATLERTGERFCAPRCDTGGPCPTGTDCVLLVATNTRFCVPTTGSCLSTRCTVEGCPSEYQCDTTSGRCYRPGAKRACQPCDFSYQCGGFNDRCVMASDTQRYCGTACPEGGCPSGFTCAEVQTPTRDTVRQCVPGATSSCERALYCIACDRDEDCSGGHCVSLSGTSGKRCVPHCELGAPCPPSSSCVVYTGDFSYVCAPTTTCP